MTPSTVLAHARRLVAGSGAASRIALAAGALGLAAAALWPLDAEPTPPPPAEPARPERAAADEALRRPVFDGERRAWTALGSREDVFGRPPPPELRVLGIVTETGGGRALVEDGAAEPTWMAVGEGRGRWRIAAIAPGEVIVTDGAWRHRLGFLGPAVALPPERRWRDVVSGPPALRTGLDAADRTASTTPAPAEGRRGGPVRTIPLGTAGGRS